MFTPREIAYCESHRNRFERYAGREQLEAGLRRLLSGVERVAMEYSPDCAIPYLSRVDAGTAEAVRRHGVEIVGSGDLVQRFEASWSEAQLATHRAASEALYRIKDRAFAFVQTKLQAGESIHEYIVQQEMAKYFREEGLVTDSDPIVRPWNDSSSATKWARGSPRVNQ